MEKLCTQCNKPFYAHPQQAHRQRFCSQQCYLTSRNSNVTPGICKRCNKTFKIEKGIWGLCRPCRSKVGRENGLKGGYRKPPRYEDSFGYIIVRTPKGAMAEHRFVMEQKLGRPLRKGESVHHINGVRSDNNPENLELWVGPIRYGQRAAQITCPHCGKTYFQGLLLQPQI